MKEGLLIESKKQRESASSGLRKRKIKNPSSHTAKRTSHGNLKTTKQLTSVETCQVRTSTQTFIMGKVVKSSGEPLMLIGDPGEHVWCLGLQRATDLCPGSQCTWLLCFSALLFMDEKKVRCAHLRVPGFRNDVGLCTSWHACFS